MAVLIAERFWCLTTRAGIDIALSVRGVSEKSGYRTWSRKCSRSHTFTIVFTLPDSLNQLCLHQPKVVYDTLFKTAWSVIDSFGRDPKWPRAQTGMIAILHTWGQQLTLHPHIHHIIPGGGLTKSCGWKSSKTLGKYLFSVTAMSKVFRGRFIEAVKLQVPAHLSQELIDDLFSKPWVVYAKRPFKNVNSVIEYLGRYSHKIAISNHRLQKISDGQVVFNYKDYKDEGKNKSMTLDAVEFVRRFSLHILPKGFTRIRHYGILSSTSKQEAIAQIRAQLPDRPIKKEKGASPKFFNPRKCPCCGQEAVQQLNTFKQRGPPIDFLKEMAEEILLMIL